MKTNLYLIATALVMVSCSSSSDKATKSERETLNSIKAQYEVLRVSLDEANSILDAIDSLRKDHRSTIGVDAKKLSDRLRNLTAYVKTTEEKIVKIEKQLRVSRNEASAYLMMVDALKSEVQIRDSELRVLEDSISRYQTILSAEARASKLP